MLALEDIDLDVQPGEFVSLIGPSGCGKSTLLRIIGDLVAPTRATVLVNGKRAHQARLDRDYGIVFQDAVLYDWRNVAKNIALPLEMAGWDRSRRQERVDEMLELVELAGFENHHPWQLSGGMQQRVSIARALSFSPPLLLMDEPFGALDEMTRERMNNELLRIWQDTRSTVVFVTHSIAEAVFLSTRVVVMSARPGRIAGVVADRPAAAAQARDARGAALRRAHHPCAPPASRGSRARRARRGRDAALRRGGGACERRRAGTARHARRTASAAASATGSRPRSSSCSESSLWEGSSRVLDVQRFLLPAPSAILDTLWDERDDAVGGRDLHVHGGARRLRDRLHARRALGASCSPASGALGRALMPYAIAANAVPIIAFAPITNEWFGRSRRPRRWRSPRCSSSSRCW